jgi:predicted ArsR family transcriptional regulator
VTRPNCIIIQDAVTLRGIIELLADAPATANEVAMTQHVGKDVARRLMQILHNAGLIEHCSPAEADAGMTSRAILQLWQLTKGYMRGDVPFEPEKLARVRA